MESTAAASTTSDSLAGRLRMTVFVLLSLINVIWAIFVVVALADHALSPSGRYRDCMIFFAVSAFTAVLLHFAIGIVSIMCRDRASANQRSPVWKLAALGVLIVVQYAAATTFAASAGSPRCALSADGCHALDKALRAGSWIAPSLLLLFVIYLALSAPRVDHAEAAGDVERLKVVRTMSGTAPTSRAPVFAIAFFRSESAPLKPPAPAYAYAAAGAVRRLSQTMFQGGRRPTTPVRWGT